MLNDRDYMRSGGQRPSRSNYAFRFDESVIQPIIIANVIVFFVQIMFRGLLESLFALDATRPVQVWRLVTYQFMHGGLWHLFFNMYGVWVFGRLVERALGPRRFLQMYLYSGAIGGVLWLLFTWRQQALCVGASGSLFGVLAVAALAFPDLRLALLFPPVALPMRTFVFIYGLIEVLNSFAPGSSGVAHLAHVGGLLGGFIYVKRLRKGNPFPNLKWIKDFIRKIDGDKEMRTMPKSGYHGGEPTPDEIDRVLEKMSFEGYDSLTQREREILERASKKLKER
jgi:membrane associated rhomboid family serine protease